VRKSEKQGNRNPSRDVASVKDAPEKTKFRERLPDFEFALRMQGTLPETVTASDLEILNSALGILFADLRRASHEHGDNGRAGTVLALGAVWRFIALFESPLREGLHVPILRLQDALVGLDNNSVAPLLKPVPQSGRTVSSSARSALKGAAAAAVKRLQMAGMDRSEAYERVARELKKSGIKPERGSKGVSANTVRHWCEAVAEDVSRTTAAAFLYDSMFTADETARFDALPKDRARDALKSLTVFVSQIFPETAEAPKKPT
jgi:hypothetical protein